MKSCDMKTEESIVLEDGGEDKKWEEWGEVVEGGWIRTE